MGKMNIYLKDFNTAKLQGYLFDLNYYFPWYLLFGPYMQKFDFSPAFHFTKLRIPPVQ